MEPQGILGLLDKTKENRERWRIGFAMNPSILVPRRTNLWERSCLESNILDEDETSLLANKKRTTNKREKGGARRYWIRYPLKEGRNLDQ